jgi:LPXTG-motif cell wall-anchored protein
VLNKFKVAGLVGIFLGTVLIGISLGSPGQATDGGGYPSTSASASASASASTSASASASASSSPSSSASTSVSPSQSSPRPSNSASTTPAPALPVTGVRTTVLLISGSLLLAIGALLFLVARRRRDVQFKV